ncbi:Glycerol-3-phosphate acyltransferase [Chlorella vulgaris]
MPVGRNCVNVLSSVAVSAPDCHDAAAWLSYSRQWAREASAASGAPPPLQILPSTPVDDSPAWRSAPNLATAAALLVPPAGGADGGSKQSAPTEADLAVAADVAARGGWFGRLTWALGLTDIFFARATAYEGHVQGLRYRQQQLLPLTVQLAVEHHGGTDLPEQQAEGLFREIAADQRPGALRLLGWMLSHLWLFNSEVYVDASSLERLRGLYVQKPGPTSVSAGVGAAAGSEQVQGVALPPRASVVYIPAHKSHLDYLVLSYVLFANGLPCPHIAAGANLSLPLVNRLLRACGAFFIRRTSRGADDAHAYKSVLAAYVHAMLVAGLSLEFFIEGGRSRDGRVNPPKLGMLRMVVDAVMAGDVDRPVYIVPTAMNYDASLEERSLAAQLAGAPKKSESLLGLASTCWAIVTKALRVRWQRWGLGLGAGGYCGRATVAFGEPINLQEWLQENQASIDAGGAEQRQAVAALGELVTASIRSSSALPTSALLLGSLFAEQHGVLTGTPGGSSQHGNGLVSSSGASAQAVATGMTWLADQLRQRGAAVVQLPQNTGSGEQQQLLLHLAGMLPRCCSVSGHGQASGSSARHEPVLRLQGGVEAALLQHSRINQLMPWFAAEALVMAPLLAASHGQQSVSAAELFESAAFLRCVLAPEIDTALGPDELQSSSAFEPVLQRLLASGALVQDRPGGRISLAPKNGGAGAASSSDSRRAALFAAALLAPLLATYLETLRAMQRALAVSGPSGSSAKALCSAAQKHLLALTAGSAAAGSTSDSTSDSATGCQFGRLVVPSVALVQGALKSLAAVGVLAAAPADAGPQPARVASSEALAAFLSSPSGRRPANGGVDEDYSVEPATPRDGKQSTVNGGHSRDAAIAAGPARSARRSFERRRPPADEERAAGSRSGSDSEDPAVADSVAANLCSMDASSNGGSLAPAARPAAAAVVAAGDGQQHWVLAHSEVVAQFADRIESLICI